MKNHNLKRLTAMFLTICSLASSLHTGNLYVKAADTKTGWNINIYMCGSSLESDYGFGSMDLVEILDAKEVPEGVQITVETGGSSRWYYDDTIKEYYKEELHMTEETIAAIHPANISSEYIQRYRVKYDNYIQQGDEWIRYPSLELISANEGVNDPETAKKTGTKAVSMGDAAVFGDFIADTVDNGTHNVVVLWNHGGGTEYGICNDGLSEYNSLTLLEMEDGFKQSQIGSGTDKIDVIGYEACLMASFETLAVTSRYADYAVACMNDSNGYGWDYTPCIEKLAGALNQGLSYSGAEFAVSVVDANIDFYLADPESKYYYPTLNIGAYDLSYMDDLVEQFDKMAQAMVHLTADDAMRDGFMQAAEKALKLGDSMDLIGMYTFLTNTVQYAQSYMEAKQNSSDAVVIENVMNCQDYVRQALIFEKALYDSGFCLKQCTGAEGNPYAAERGIGLYYPGNDTADMTGFAKSQYDELKISDYYAAFVYNVFCKVNAKQTVTPKTTLTWNVKKGKYVLNLTNTEIKYMAYVREIAYLKVDGKKIRVRSVRGTEKSSSMECAPVVYYYTFRNEPVYVETQDPDSKGYSMTFDINGSGMQKLYFYIKDGMYVTYDGLQPGDVITPYRWDENDEMTLDKDLTYTVQESDVAQDGSVCLPMNKKKGKTSDFTYDFAVGNYFGEETHKWVNHPDTLSFVKAKATLSKKTYKATGQKIYPKVTVKSGSKTLKKGTDYKLVYSNNIAAGKATVTVVGLGKYKYAPAKTLTFTIKVNK